MSVRLTKEIARMKNIPIEGFVFSSISEPDSEGTITLVGNLKGPEGTPYEFGEFPIEIKFPRTYPMTPPSVKFLPPVPFHPNVYTGLTLGKICITILDKTGAQAWSPVMNTETIIHSIRSLLADLSAESMANQEAGALVRSNPDEFNRQVKDRMIRAGQYKPPSGLGIPSSGLGIPSSGLESSEEEELRRAIEESMVFESGRSKYKYLKYKDKYFKLKRQIENAHKDKTLDFTKWF